MRVATRPQPRWLGGAVAVTNVPHLMRGWAACGAQVCAKQTTYLEGEPDDEGVSHRGGHRVVLPLGLFGWLRTNRAGRACRFPGSDGSGRASGPQGRHRTARRAGTERCLRRPWTQGAGFTLYLFLSKNGSVIKQSVQLINYTAGFNQSMNVDTIVYLNGTTDYLDGSFETNSGTATILGGSSTTFFSANYVHD